MTQKEFAEYLEIPQRRIENWESGANKPPAYTINLIEFKLKYGRAPEDLQELTGQESGIIVYSNGNTIVRNWSHGRGLPQYF